MRSVFRAWLVGALGLGCLGMDCHAKPALAFLGLSPDSDPLIRAELERRIRGELAADSSLSGFAQADIDMLFAKGILTGPEAGPRDMPRLARGLPAQFYAYGYLQPMTLSSSRIWWKPWKVNVTLAQGLRWRVLEGNAGRVIYDGIVPVTLPEHAFLWAPENRFSRMGPLERDAYLRKLMPLLSAESAKALSKAVAGSKGGFPKGP